MNDDFLPRLPVFIFISFLFFFRCASKFLLFSLKKFFVLKSERACRFFFPSMGYREQSSSYHHHHLVPGVVVDVVAVPAHHHHPRRYFHKLLALIAVDEKGCTRENGESQSLHLAVSYETRANDIFCCFFFLSFSFYVSLMYADCCLRATPPAAAIKHNARRDDDPGFIVRNKTVLDEKKKTGN